MAGFPLLSVETSLSGHDPIADIWLMREEGQMGAINLFSRFVDWDLRRKPMASAGNLTILVGILPWFALAATAGGDSWPILSAPAIAAIAFDLLWFGLCGWRLWLLFRSAAERADRLYDTKGKYLLSSEYADTESATKARRRRRKVR